MLLLKVYYLSWLTDCVKTCLSAYALFSSSKTLTMKKCLKTEGIKISWHTKSYNDLMCRLHFRISYMNNLPNLTQIMLTKNISDKSRHILKHQLSKRNFFFQPIHNFWQYL